MKHPTAWPLLDRFLDGVLDSETRWAVAAHLAECPTCQAYLAEQARMRAFVRGRLSRVTAPEGLAGRIQTRLREGKPRQAMFHWPRLWQIPLVATSLALLLLLVLGWWLLFPSPPSSDLMAELATPHLLFAQDDNLLEIAGTQMAIQSWFQDKVSFPVMIPDLPEYTLQGGRLVAVNRRRAVQLIYENERVKQYLSLLYFESPLLQQSSLKPASSFKVGQYGNITIVSWSDGQTSMALVANRSADHLLRLAEQMGNK